MGNGARVCWVECVVDIGYWMLDIGCWVLVGS